MSITKTEHDISEKTFEALYNINKHAKKYAELADKNYHRGKKATAKQNSLKKKALYDLKSDILDTITEKADEIVVHEINGSDYYCLYFADWSFHTPTDDLSIDSDRIESEENLDTFEKDAEKEHSDMSLKASLLHLQEVFGYSANEYLVEEYVSYGRNSYFAGWSYLD